MTAISLVILNFDIENFVRSAREVSTWLKYWGLMIIISRTRHFIPVRGYVHRHAIRLRRCSHLITSRAGNDSVLIPSSQSVCFYTGTRGGCPKQSLRRGPGCIFVLCSSRHTKPCPVYGCATTAMVHVLVEETILHLTGLSQPAYSRIVRLRQTNTVPVGSGRCPGVPPTHRKDLLQAFRRHSGLRC